MADRVRELLNKVLEWWNKFSTRQKTFIISAGAGIILALAILITVLTRPHYIVLLNCETTKEAAEVAELLEGEGLDLRCLMTDTRSGSIRISSQRQVYYLVPMIFNLTNTPLTM